MNGQLPAVGDNRTSRSQHPSMYDDMAKGPDEFGPTSHGDTTELLTEMRGRYVKESEPIGHVAPLAKKKAASPAMVEFVDKLGERLAFERTGTRLYEGLLSKYDTYGSFAGGPSREDLEQIRQEEHEHFLLLKSVVSKIGGDPVAVTPSANVAATLSRGILDVIADPRTNLLQSLEAILVAELTDHASWRLLIEIGRKAGHDQFTDVFERAFRTEEEHLEKVRSWIEGAHGL